MSWCVTGLAPRRRSTLMIDLSPPMRVNASTILSARSFAIASCSTNAVPEIVTGSFAAQPTNFTAPGLVAISQSTA